ncbi:MAG TPA: SRPBCC family protein [Mycobacteriales bacterium]|nr:SRPBCC family protein [Mycobacteriales bacterium]
MPEVTVSVDVVASPERVWQAAVDWPTQQRWMFLTRVWPTAGTGHAVGDRLSAFTGVGPVGFLDTMEITAYDAPRRCVVRHTGRVVRGSAAFEVVPLGPDRARFVWTEWLDLPLGVLGQAGFALLRPLILWPLRRSLRRFADLAAES